MESDEQQELRARERIRPNAVIKASVIAGILVFVVPAGGPWMSQEAFTAAMGRVISSSWLVDVIAHFVFALIYGWILAACIFRLPLAGGIVLGVLLAVPLYGFNYLLFAVIGGQPKNEMHVVIEHFMFCLFFSVAYRAMAVPPPRGAPAKREVPIESR